MKGREKDRYNHFEMDSVSEIGVSKSRERTLKKNRMKRGRTHTHTYINRTNGTTIVK